MYSLNAILLVMTTLQPALVEPHASCGEISAHLPEPLDVLQSNEQLLLAVLKVGSGSSRLGETLLLPQVAVSYQ